MFHKYFFHILEYSWKEIETQKRNQLERQLHENELKSILSDLQQIREKIRFYMNINEIEFENEKLPIKIFNLDISGTERMYDVKLKERIAEKIKLEQICLDEKLIIDNIKKHTWDRLKVKPTKIRSIAADYFIENYPLCDLDERLGNDLIINEILQMPDLVKTINDFQPWTQKSMNSLSIELPKVMQQTAKNIHFERFSTAATKIIDRNLKAKPTSSHLFITPIPTQIIQIEIDDEHQVYEHNIKTYVSIQFHIYYGVGL